MKKGYRLEGKRKKKKAQTTGNTRVKVVSL